MVDKPAIVVLKRFTRSPPTAELATGHFHVRRRYSAWREFGTQDWLLIYTLGGAGRFGWGGGEFTAKPGEIVLIAPETLHDYGLESGLKRWELLWAHFIPRAAWMAWLKWPAVAPGLMRLNLADPEIRGRIRQRFADANRLMRGALPNREAFAMNALEEVLLWCDTLNAAPGRAAVDPRVRRALEYLCDKPERRVTLASLAQYCCLSPSRLAHLFREQVGQPPLQYLETQRIGRARQLLEETQTPVKEIAFALGFENPFYFSLRFKRYTRLSPRAYREKHAGRRPKKS